jgi:uncharacterized membrane protein
MNAEALSVPGLRGENVNVAAPERLLCVFAGGMLASMALRRKSWASAALATGGGFLLWRGFSGHCVGYQAAGINTAEPEQKVLHSYQLITINKPSAELYEFWRHFGNLPSVVECLESVRVVDEKHSVWAARGLGGKVIEWTAEITADEPGKRIEWKSEDGALIPNSGSIEFRPAPGDRGTEVRVNVDYQPPAGYIGLGLAKVFGRTPDAEIREGLRRFKQMMETGEIPTTDGQPAAHTHSLFDAIAR